MNKKAFTQNKNHSRVFLSGIFNAGRSCLLLRRQFCVEGPRLQISGVVPLFNNGFTLVELLVVVLIIGILAAVALPQYQKAVLKSQITQALVVFDTYRKGIALWHLANGLPPQATTITGTTGPGLDIGMPVKEQSETRDFIDGYAIWCKIFPKGQAALSIGGWNPDGSDSKWKGCGLRWDRMYSRGEVEWRFSGILTDNVVDKVNNPVPEKCIPMAKIFCQYWGPTKMFRPSGKAVCDSVGVSVEMIPEPALPE